MQKRPIPNYVDEQMQIFFWEVDEFLPAVAIFVLCFMWGQILLGIALSLVFVRLLSKFKVANQPGAILHFVWWAGFVPLNKRFPNGMHRELIK